MSKSQETHILASYDEIGLKGKNRQHFVDKLLNNIRVKTGLHQNNLVTHRRGRIYIRLPRGTKPEPVMHQLRHVFGLRWFSRAHFMPLDYDMLCDVALNRAVEEGDSGNQTFKIETRRVNKEYPKRSLTVNRELGELIRTGKSGLSVDVHDPDIIFNVEIRSDRFLLYTTKQKGPGGLPVGTNGSTLHLISGGIDSPVAAWYLMKRGLLVDFIYFHSPPYTGIKALEKVRSLVRKLQEWHIHPVRLYLPDFSSVQEEIAEKCDSPFWTLLFRRYMHRIAGKLADDHGYDAISTGDSLGQVASQTLTNLHSIDDADDHLVLRPLLGMEKMDVMNKARRIGTYNISIEPYEDCCTLFAPKRPVIQSKPKRVRFEEKELDTSKLVSDCIDSISTEDFGENDESRLTARTVIKPG